MQLVLAVAPLLLVLGLMVLGRWGAHKAGPVAWLTGLGLAWLGFGITPEVLWVSQAKGLLLSGFVLAVMWPALLLYHWMDRMGGVRALADFLLSRVPHRGLCLVLLAWALSGALEGIAGFGLPIAIVAPMLTALGVPPIRAVAAVAVGHSWSVTFGDMGVIFQTLVAVVGLEPAVLIPPAALLLGIACVLCGLGAAIILGQSRLWRQILVLGSAMAMVQFLLATAGLTPLAALGAGLCGLKLATHLGRSAGKRERVPGAGAATHSESLAKASGNSDSRQRPEPEEQPSAATLKLLFAVYGAIALLLASVSLIPWLHDMAMSVAWKPLFPEVATSAGFKTPAGPGQVFRPLMHPGSLILLVALAAIAWTRLRHREPVVPLTAIVEATIRSAGLASLGIVAMVGLAMLMDHSGMSLCLARGLSDGLGSLFPVASPFVGMLGAFATGSNNNSNVLFGSLQKNTALLLGADPQIMVASQTAGGSVGSMIAPAKLVVGCATTGLSGRDGEALRQTLPFGLLIGLGLGLATWILLRF